MQISDYSYVLPKDKIAQYPPAVRGQSRLLVLNKNTGSTEDRRYADIVDYLDAGDVLVLNDTKVIKARLMAQGDAGSDTELVLLEKHGKVEDKHRHKVLYRGNLHKGQILYVGQAELQVEQAEGGIAVVSSAHDIEDITTKNGSVPLPPYMKRDATVEDEQRYQTVFAHTSGSVAAPTASLNMTEELLDSLRRKGVVVAYLTLHVGLGTFLPIRSDDVTEHKMHSEYFEIPEGTVRSLQQTRQRGGKIAALGTTVVRTLEFAHDAIFESDASDVSGEADIFIYPGYEFKSVDMLITNFHAPKSTVLMLAAAFAGWDNLRQAYEHALQNDYAFLSYGDSMLIR